MNYIKRPFHLTTASMNRPDSVNSPSASSTKTNGGVRFDDSPKKLHDREKYLTA